MNKKNPINLLKEIVNKHLFPFEKVITVGSTHSLSLKPINRELYNKFCIEYPNIFKGIGEFIYFTKKIDQIDNLFKELTCPICGNKNNFINHTMGYYKHCSVKCTNQDPIDQKKRQDSMIKKYGVPFTAMSSDLMEKMKKTSMEKYGVECTLLVPEVQEKIKETMIERYGVERAIFIPGNLDKLLQTNNPELQFKKREKIKQTNLKRYGSESFMGTDKFYQKSKETRNGLPIGASKEEEKIFNILQEKFNDVKWQYKDKRYKNYICDFYIPSLDLFIEYQGYISHNTKPYDPKNIEHQKEVQNLKKLIEISSFYKALLDDWTVKDPAKRKLANDNNLNWIEFFTMHEFLDWFKKIK